MYTSIFTFVPTCSSLASRVEELCEFPDRETAARVLDGLRWIGLFSSDVITLRGPNLLDTLCAHLGGRLGYGPGERDLVLLQHCFTVEWADGSVVRPWSVRGQVNGVLMMGA